jgi:hypothetical protein
VVMGIGQAAGMAAAMCIELNCQPRDLPVRSLQTALLTDERSPVAIVPLFNLLPSSPDWLQWQMYYLDNPDSYPINGYSPAGLSGQYLHLNDNQVLLRTSNCFTGIFQRQDQQDYRFTMTAPQIHQKQTWQLVTLRSHIDQQLQALPHKQQVKIWGRLNPAGNWLLVEHLAK